MVGGGIGAGGSVSALPATPTLADIGIDKRTSSRAQRLAALPEQKFAAITAGEISVAKAIALPPKKASAKTRAHADMDAHKTVIADEGGSALIVVMRSATPPQNSCGVIALDPLEFPIVYAKTA